MFLTDVELNTQAVEAGEWVDDLPDGDGIRIRARSLNCKLATIARDKKVRALPSKVRKAPGGIPSETMERITAEILHEVCILDWDGLFESAGGPAVPYSPETAAKLLLDDRYRPFRDIALVAATRVGQNRDETVEEATGN
ncbi:MAG: hypothetical protein J0H82_25955 [Alphaproteobacteria bacterium]|nr:hypothetical protein [Alphaproteobacteria bacterium]